MKTWQCMCGYQAASNHELADHLGEQFIPADDTDATGQLHAEAARDQDATELSRADCRCLCGFAAPDLASFDAHLLAVFTPPDGIGADRRRHGKQRQCSQPHS